MVYRSNFFNFFLFILVFNLIILVVSYLFYEIGITTYITLGIINAYAVLHTFSLARPTKINIDKENKIIKVNFFRFFLGNMKKQFHIKDLTFRYKRELVGRNAREKILRAYNSSGKQVIVLSPELFWWKEADVNSIAKTLKDIAGDKFIIYDEDSIYS